MAQRLPVQIVLSVKDVLHTPDGMRPIPKRIYRGFDKNLYNFFLAVVRPPTYIVWSTDQIDLSDPFQRRWYIQRVLRHGRREDIRTLNLEEIASILDAMILPEDVRSLWQRFLEMRRAQG